MSFKIFVNVWRHGNLKLDSELSGRFRESNKAVDLKSVMRVIDDVRKEEAAKQLRKLEAQESPD